MLSKTSKLSDLVASIESYKTEVEADSSDDRKIKKHAAQGCDVGAVT